MADGTGGRDALSRGLSDARAAANPRLQQQEAAARLGWPKSRLSRIENGKQVPTVDDVKALTTLYRVDPAVRRALVALAEDVRESNRRLVAYRDPAGIQDRMARIDQASRQITQFYPSIIPGLLQSPDYVRAVMRTAGWSTADAERAVNGRLARQAALRDPNSDQRWLIVLTEGALGWALGEPAMMIEQLELIAEVAALPPVTVGIVPFGKHAQVVPLTGWDLYDQRFCVVGTLTATTFLDQPSDLARYLRLAEAVEELAVYDDDARAILAEVADRYRSMK